MRFFLLYLFPFLYPLIFVVISISASFYFDGGGGARWADLMQFTTSLVFLFSILGIAQLTYIIKNITLESILERIFFFFNLIITASFTITSFIFIIAIIKVVNS